MHSTLYQKQNDDPHDVLVASPDVALVVPTDEELSRLAQTMRQSSDPRAGAESDPAAGATIPPVDTTFRPTVSDASGQGRTIGGRAARGFTAALLLALCTGAAAFAWEGYGDEGKSMIAQWVPQRVLALILPLEKPAPAEQPTPPAVEAAAVDTPPAQPAPSPPAAPEAAAPAAAASVEPAEQLRSMARDLASAGQQIEQLKASIEDLKASQQQMSREIAKASEAKASEARPAEPNLRPRLAALPPRPAATRVRRPMPPLPPPPQAATYPALPPAAAPPYPPRQVEPLPQATTQTLGDPELAAVPRPPMPVR
jgi:hypothetical protein